MSEILKGIYKLFTRDTESDLISDLINGLQQRELGYNRQRKHLVYRDTDDTYKRFGQVFHYDSRSYTSFANAISTIGSENCTLVVSQQEAVNSNLTTPENIHLFLTGAGSFDTGSGFTLTINGQITAPHRKIFYGSGTAVLGTLASQDYPQQWWEGDRDSFFVIGQKKSSNARYYSLGIDESDSSKFKISYGTAGALPGTNDYLSIDISGTVNVYNGLTVAGTLGVTGATSLSTLSTSGLATLNSLAVTGTSTLIGNVIVGADASTNTAIYLNGIANTAKELGWKVANVYRWIWDVSGAESTGNAGSLIRLRARTDGGIAIDDVISIVRAAGGTMSLSRPVSMASTLDVAGNVHTSGTGTGYWLNSLGTFTYGMYQSSGSLLFRSGSTTPWLTVTSAGLPTIANATTINGTLSVNATLNVNSDAAGSSWGTNIITSSSGNGTQSIDNIRDHALNVFRIRMRTAGTPVIALSLDGTGLATFGASINIPDSSGIVTTVSAQSRTVIGRSGNALTVGDADAFTSMNFRLNSGTFTWTTGSSPATALTLTSTTMTVPIALAVTGAVTLSSSLTFAAGQDILIGDNSASALTITQGGNPYLRFITTDGSEKASFFKSLEAQSTLIVTGVATFTAGIISGSDDALLRTVGTGQTAISGGTSSSSGANILLYGATHATLANQWRIRHGSTNDISYDGTSITITPATTVTGLITASAGITIGGGTFAVGKIYSTAGSGIVIAGKTGSTYDLHLAAASGADVITVATGTSVATFASAPIFSSVTASQFLSVNGSKALTSVASTGSGSVVLSASPTLTGTIGAAAMTLSSTLLVSGVATFTLAPVLSAGTASTALALDGSKNIVSVTNTGSGNNVLSASPTLTGTVGAAAMTLSSTFLVSGVATFTLAPVLSAGTASTALALDGSKNIVSVTNTGSGNNVLSASPTLTGTVGAAALTLSSTLSVTGTSTFSGGISSVASLSGGFYEEGSYTTTLTGVSGTVTATAYWVKVGKKVTLFLPSITGTSNSSSCTLTGAPSAIFPTRGQRCPLVIVWDNDTEYQGHATVSTSAVITLSFRTDATTYSSTFTASGSKGLGGVSTISYSLN